MRLYLLRHAEAAPGIPDAGRLLTERGFGQIDALTATLDWTFLSDLKQVEHSGLVRARQTGERLVAQLKSRVPLQVRPGLRPNDDPVLLGLDLAVCKKDRLLVGHNPHLARLGGMLLAGAGQEVPLVLKKAGCIGLERQRSASKEKPFGQWTLLWMISPGRFAKPTE